jgi:hypothetical protein
MWRTALCGSSKSLLDPPHQMVFYWDLARPHTKPMDTPFPPYAYYMKGSLIYLEHEKQERARMVAKELCDSGPIF